MSGATPIRWVNADFVCLFTILDIDRSWRVLLKNPRKSLGLVEGLALFGFEGKSFTVQLIFFFDTLAMHGLGGLWGRNREDLLIEFSLLVLI
jgi:hypothetical protein